MSNEPLTLNEVLAGAIQKEIEAHRLYEGMSESVTEPAVKDAFRDLAKQEDGHRKLLEEYWRGEIKEGALHSGQRIDYRIAEALDQPAVTPDISLKDAFLLAANREKVSHDFYLALAGIHPEGRIKGLFLELADQEMGHKHRVEYLYTEVAFPQTDGG
ncbi:MAG: ferritin family protein [Chloroflexota bacterium]